MAPTTQISSFEADAASVRRTPCVVRRADDITEGLLTGDVRRTTGAVRQDGGETPASATGGNTKLSLIAVSIVLALGAGCETSVEIDLPDYQPQLVVNGTFQAQTALAVQVTQSQGILEDGPLEEVEQARVLLYEGDTLIDSLAPGRGYATYWARTRPQAGRTYTLRVSAPGFEDVEATDRLPAPVPFDFEAEPHPERYEGGRYYTLTLTLDDPADQEQFYALSFWSIDPYNRTREQVLFMSADPILRENDVFGEYLGEDERTYLEAVFSDATIDGRRHRLRLNVWFNTILRIDEEIVQDYEVELATLSRHYYDFLRTRSLYRITSGNPFAEPVQVHSNVERGLGIFAGRSAVAWRMRVTGGEIVASFEPSPEAVKDAGLGP